MLGVGGVAPQWDTRSRSPPSSVMRCTVKGDDREVGCPLSPFRVDVLWRLCMGLMPGDLREYSRTRGYKECLYVIQILLV